MKPLNEGKTAAQIIEDLIVNHTKEKIELLEKLRVAQEQNAKLALAANMLSKAVVFGFIVIGVNALERRANQK